MRPEMKFRSTMKKTPFTIHCRRNEMKFRFGSGRSETAH